MLQRRRAVAYSRVLFVALFLGLTTQFAVAEASPPEDADEQPVLEALSPGSDAVVNTGGTCLNLRDAPALDGESLTCMLDGTRVTVLDGSIENDGHHWQHVQWNSEAGWASVEFLRPASASTGGNGGSCQDGNSVGPGFNGGLYTGGGISMAQWGGGTIAGMQNRSVAEGCDIRSVWATSDGNMLGYIAGARDFVNADFLGVFPDGYVPPGQLVIVDCRPHNGNISASSAATMVPPPNGNAPRLVGSESPPSISASAAVLVDGDSGEILWEKDAHDPRHPASLTKIVTAIVAIEGADLDSWVTSDVDGRNMPGSSLMGLRDGDCFTVRDLLYGLMLPSGNDAALAIGRFIGLSDDEFVHHMNTLAARLNMTSSSFTDPHGLGGSDHRMSAYDIALASRYGMTLPAFREIVKARNWVASGSREITLHNVNTFLSSYPDGDGIKTGYTGSAGRTLSASAERDGNRLFVVVLNAHDRHRDAAKLLDWAFDNHAWD